VIPKKTKCVRSSARSIVCLFVGLSVDGLGGAGLGLSALDVVC
jgi:hypothetical protein